MKLGLKLIAIAFMIALSFVLSLWYLGLIGIATAVPSSIVIIVLTNLDWIASLGASSYKVFRRVNFYFEKNAVAKRIENTIGVASKKVNGEGLALLPHGVKIKWVEPMKREAFLEEGKVIVCLESSDNEARNLARTTILYVDDEIIRDSQRFIDPQVFRSLCFSISRKLLMLDKKLEALKCLNEEFVEPEAKAEPRIRNYVVSMAKMDEQGYLTRILLREFSQLDIKLSPAATNLNALSETVTFTHFLGTFVQREREEDVNLSHNRRILKVSLMPIARSVVGFNVSSYTGAASRCFDNGINTIYVLAWAFNIPWAKEAVKAIEQTGKYTKIDEHAFTAVQENRFQSYLAILANTGNEKPL